MSLKVTVSGPAWVGKTTLAADIASYLESRGATVEFKEEGKPVKAQVIRKPEGWHGRRVLITTTDQ